VWCMYVCTRPHFCGCEIVNVYTVVNAITCVRAASLLGVRGAEAAGVIGLTPRHDSSSIESELRQEIDTCLSRGST